MQIPRNIKTCADALKLLRSIRRIIQVGVSNGLDLPTLNKASDGIRVEISKVLDLSFPDKCNRIPTAMSFGGGIWICLDNGNAVQLTVTPAEDVPIDDRYVYHSDKPADFLL